MVVIHVKGSDGDGFLFETTTDTKNEDLIQSLVNLQNLRSRAKVIVDSVRGLAQYGMMKDGTVGGRHAGATVVSSTNDNQNHPVVECQENSKNILVDPTGLRIGNPPEDGRLVQTLLQTAKDLEEYVDKNQVQKRIALTIETLQDKISNVRGAVVMAYPMGLPEYDLVRISLDDESLESTFVANDILDPNTTTLWCAGKEFQRGKAVSDRLGCNEKTKVIAKLQKQGSGPPGREPIVNEQERQAMMAHYFKRQEELKRLAEVDDDDYLNSQWADSKEMKRSLQGLDRIKAPGFRFS
eukprot:CAMPEP_0176502750 /NCGR_PEP_ID=MMETSP0200_2-20121128/14938_1 /TAXON_ID=947934 /ORGANISM="Chaetoceros sp., Strain GSL56" /LENGTH=295 /DNA_ID=CAMNT_0017901879 /DNA_START=106 /DNA_END=993 /DNA_ORIENTATION=+